MDEVVRIVHEVLRQIREEYRFLLPSTLSPSAGAKPYRAVPHGRGAGPSDPHTGALPRPPTVHSSRPEATPARTGPGVAATVASTIMTIMVL